MSVHRAIEVLEEKGIKTLCFRSIGFAKRMILLEFVPSQMFAIAAPLYWKFHPNRPTGKLQYDQESDIWVITDQFGNEFFTPNPKVRHGQEPHAEARVEDYTLDGFVTLKEGDTVVDAGSFVGGFSIGAAQVAKRVIAIEPDPRSAECTRRNTSKFGNVSVIEKAVWKEADTMKFNISADPTDNSLLSPDWGEKSTVSVKADRFDSILKQAGIKAVDFLKMDAEGAEPEALSGIDEIKPSKIAVDCSAEREGEDTIDEVTELLQSKGYQIRHHKQKLFAKLKR